MVEIQEGYKVPFAFAQVLGNRPIRANHLINIWRVGFLTNAEALEAGITEQHIYAVDGGTRIYISLVKVGDCSCNFSFGSPLLGDFPFESGYFFFKCRFACLIAGNLVLQHESDEFPHSGLAFCLLSGLLVQNGIVFSYELVESFDDCRKLVQHRCDFLNGNDL